MTDKFFYKMDPNCTDTELMNFFIDICATPIEVLQQKAQQARNYFDATVKTYFSDPTGNFVQFLKNHKQIQLNP